MLADAGKRAHDKMNLAQAIHRPRAALAALLLLGLLIRLPPILAGFHVSRDLELYIRWGQAMQAGGVLNAYGGPIVNVNRPLLLYLFDGAAWVEAQFGQPGPPGPGANRLATGVIQLAAALADVLAAGLLAA